MGLVVLIMILRVLFQFRLYGSFWVINIRFGKWGVFSLKSVWYVALGFSGNLTIFEARQAGIHTASRLIRLSKYVALGFGGLLGIY
ncbi:hypothetical protein KY46_07925 [Photobacterium halotolerans]|uniref:Uncharacterized protein n=1 Tax=Photobacterium halotolerans TaxID=265726 RepID=A0A0F5VGE1_9GAMM|nr:hypothetical protein KY46_07925 [Photobacterium halotolerans]